MSPGTAKTIVLITGGGMLAFVALEAKAGTAQGSTYKKVWAIGLLTLALGIVSDFAPQLTGAFAVLVLLAAYGRHEGLIGNVIGAPAKPAAKPTGRVGGAQ